jgi:ABC-type phosphate/phosphonate transport system substrate-binding protein
MTNVEAIAAFPMYDFAGLQIAHDQLWTALRGYLNDSGFSATPRKLTRDMHHEQIWLHPQLLLSQACEYPLAKCYPGRVRLIATPRYGISGCTGTWYRSAILVRSDDGAATLADLRGKHCVVNDLFSNSGMNMLRAAIAPIASGGRFFGSVRVSGSHLESMRRVAGSLADVCAVDCVSLEYLRRLEPATTGSLRSLGWSPASPSLPFVTSATAGESAVERLRLALRAFSVDLSMVKVREQLHLDGFDLEPAEGFAEVLKLEKAASLWGYQELH